MNNNQGTELAGQPEASQEEVLYGHTGRDLDWFLQDLVEIASKGNEFGVTLHVEGLIVSGMLIGGDKYFCAFGELMTSGIKGDDETIASVRQTYARLADDYRSQRDDADRLPPEYIHLRDAKVFGAGQSPIPGNGSLWRGRLSAVSAWSLGSLG